MLYKEIPLDKVGEEGVAETESGSRDLVEDCGAHVLLIARYPFVIRVHIVIAKHNLTWKINKPIISICLSCRNLSFCLSFCLSLLYGGAHVPLIARYPLIIRVHSVDVKHN